MDNFLQFVSWKLFVCVFFSWTACVYLQRQSTTASAIQAPRIFYLSTEGNKTIQIKGIKKMLWSWWCRKKYCHAKKNATTKIDENENRSVVNSMNEATINEMTVENKKKKQKKRKYITAERNNDYHFLLPFMFIFIFWKFTFTQKRFFNGWNFQKFDFNQHKRQTKPYLDQIKKTIQFMTTEKPATQSPYVVIYACRLKWHNPANEVFYCS